MNKSTLKKIFLPVIFFLVIILFASSIPLINQPSQTPTTNTVSQLSQSTQSSQTQPTACIYYFYGIGCPLCANVKPVLEQLEVKYPQITIKRFEIYENKSNSLLFNNLLDSYNYNGTRGIPAIFIADKSFLGDKPIIENLEKEILNRPSSTCPSPEQTQQKPLAVTSIFAIAGAAIVDSINPCAIAVLLILLTSFFAIGKPKRALKSGLAFTLAIFIMYLLIGFGLISLFRGIHSIWAGTAYILRIILGIFAILLGLANLKDFFWYGRAFIMEIPIKWRPMMKKMLRAVTSPKGAFLAGIFVTAFELPCTGGPYFFVTAYLADKISSASILPILLFYNLIFILPLLLLNFSFYFGFTTIEKTERWRQSNLRILHLITGLILLALGVMVLVF
jgi:cytochrome c biogenesis protein CcdA/glutaredoxin-related protein